jgi:hypothetical protein
MRQADVHAGEEYAHRRESSLFGEVDADHVKVIGDPAGGEVEIKFLNTVRRTWGETPRRGSRAVVRTRDLVCRWGEWPSVRADLVQKVEGKRAAAEAFQAKSDAEEAADPNRSLPEHYDGWAWRGASYVDEVVLTLQRAFSRADVATDVRAVFEAIGWRIPVRDLAAAFLATAQEDVPYLDDLRASDEPWSDDAKPLPVRDVYRRSAKLLDTLEWEPLGDGPAHSRWAFADHDEEFLAACENRAREQGGDLQFPVTPTIPGWLLERTQRIPGWARLSIGFTSGRKIHAPDCHVLRSNKDSHAEADTIPAWEAAVLGQSECGVCNGPQARLTAELVAFRTASDAWQARRGGEIEDWQMRAVVRFAAESDYTRGRHGDLRTTLSARVWDALAEGRPTGTEGWEMYYVLVGRPRRWNTPDHDTIVDPSIARQAVERVMTLVEMLPDRPRADVPDAVRSIMSGERRLVSQDSTIAMWVQEQERRVEEEIPEPTLALFGLEGRQAPW